MQYFRMHELHIGIFPIGLEGVHLQPSMLVQTPQVSDHGSHGLLNKGLSRSGKAGSAGIGNITSVA